MRGTRQSFEVRVQNLRGKMPPPLKSFSELIIRGTPEWDKREMERWVSGCRCISTGPIPMGYAVGEPYHGMSGEEVEQMIDGTNNV
jgi:hypothetical protein